MEDDAQKIVDEIVDEVVAKFGICPTIVDLAELIEAEDSGIVSEELSASRAYFEEHLRKSGGCSRCKKTWALLGSRVA